MATATYVPYSLKLNVRGSVIFPLKEIFIIKFLRFPQDFQEVPVKDQNFQGQIKILEILENFHP